MRSGEPYPHLYLLTAAPIASFTTTPIASFATALLVADILTSSCVCGGCTMCSKTNPDGLVDVRPKFAV